MKEKSVLDIKDIIARRDELATVIKHKNFKVTVDEVIAAYDAWKAALQDVESIRQQLNANAKAMAQKAGDKAGDKGAMAEAVAAGRAFKEQLATAEALLVEREAEYKRLMLLVPNFVADDVPVGADDGENVEVARWGTPRAFDFEPKDHVELGEARGLIDFEAGAKVVGSKFYYLRGKAALLELALIRFVMDIAVKHGFEPLLVPDMAREDMLVGSGYTPRGEETQIYSIENSDLCMIGTAEIAVGGLHSGEVLLEEQLPKKYVAFSHCFRTEAGSGGRESRGLYRVHQFSKVELYAFTTPEQSPAMLEQLRAIEEEVFQSLELPYHVVNICTGDLGAPAFKKYDIEAWMPCKKAYGEVTSASNCTDFQARRLDVKYKTAEGKKGFVHTLNGTGIAVARAILMLMENHQQADGSVRIPAALQPYTGFESM